MGKRSSLRLELPDSRSRRFALILGAGISVIAVVGFVVVTTRPLPSRGPVTTSSPLALASPAETQVAPSAFASPLSPASSPTQTPTSVVTDPPRNSKWALPAGWRYDLVCDEEQPCVLHLFDAASREQDGWPVAVAGDCSGWVVVGPRESAFVPCTRNGSAVVTAFGRDGRPLRGWPVSVAGSIAWPTWSGTWGDRGPLAIGPDGTVFLGVNPRANERRFDIHAFAPDGSKRKGWPATLPGGAQGFDVAPDGLVVGWWYEGIVDALDLRARRTRFTTLDRRGDALPGWPIGSVGAASGPVIWPDGSIAYTSATGKVWAHDRTGEIIKGWPYRIPYQIAPIMRSDGRLVFVGGSEVHVVDKLGRAVAGWPWHTKGDLDGPTCDVDTEGSAMYALDADATLYVAPWMGSRAEVRALAPNGTTRPGWPYRVPAGWRVTSLEPGSDGTLKVALTGGDCFQEFDATSIRLSSRGSLVGDAPGTPLAVVYDSLRPDRLRTMDRQTSYARGSEVAFSFELVNRASTPITLPLIDYDGRYYAAGTIQTWLERLGPEADIDCFPGAARKEHWYATGGWIAVSTVPVKIDPRGTLPSLFDVTLTSDQTSCMSSGDYRFHVEYKPLGGELEDVIAQTSLEFTIAAAEVSPSPETADPRPTATPAPAPIAG